MKKTAVTFSRETILKLVCDLGLTPMLILCGLAATTDERNRTSVSLETLASTLGLHRRTVSRHINRLAELGYVTQRTGPGRGEVVRCVVQSEVESGIEIEPRLLELGDGLPVLLVLMAMANGGATFRSTMTEIVKSCNASRKTVQGLLRRLAHRSVIRIRRVSRPDIEIAISDDANNQQFA
jgi:DNA-binding MarR family transcriptional regulator